MSKIYNNMTELVGNTPLVRVNRLTEGTGATLLAKLEMFNPGFCVKDRIGLAMIESLAIYCLVIILIILFRNPLLEYIVNK